VVIEELKGLQDRMDLKVLPVQMVREDLKDQKGQQIQVYCWVIEV
jgi:hypothetical protein